MPAVAFGTAQLCDLVEGCRPADMLEEAWSAGFRRFDTAPMYGGGRAEQEVGAFLSRHPGVDVVTTKVGLPPEPRRTAKRLAVAMAKRALPPTMVGRLRSSVHGAPRPAERELHSGRFAVPALTVSVEESLRRLGGRIDRLLLHEIRPLDVTPELLELLAGLLRRGDVGAVGVATRNLDTAEVLAAGGELLTVANVAVGPLEEPVELPTHVTTRIGHGLLGENGDHLKRLQAVLDADDELAERWRSATAGTEFDGDGGLARVLLSRGPHLDVTEVLVATTQRGRVRQLLTLASRAEPLPAAVTDILADLTPEVPATPS